MTVALWIATVAGAFAVSWVGTLALIRLLAHGNILDHPNERSSHSLPVPRGGGIAVIATLAMAWTALAVGGPVEVTGLSWLLVALVALAVLGWLDDLFDLSILIRLPIHVVAVVIGLQAIDPAQTVFQGLLPLWADRLAAGLCWLWFVNLYNFMDGIDGLAAQETVMLGIGVAAIGLILGVAAPLAPLGAAAAAAAAGFWWWNAHPARIFLGDVGSAPLGFAMGWLLLSLAAAGAWTAALILPAYFLADATITLARRVTHGERFWVAHRKHFYQQGIRRGMSHAGVVRAVLVANAGLVALACTSLAGGAIPALLAAAALVAMLLAYLARGVR